MTLFTILVDTREQKPWEFTDYRVETREVTLSTADYTLECLCSYSEQQDTYHPGRAIERKSPDDFLSSIFRHRSRFQDEIQRAETWEEPLEVVIEAPWPSFQNRYSEALRYRDVHPSQIKGTVDSWSDYFNVEWEFCESRAAAERYCFDRLATWYRLYGETV